MTNEDGVRRANGKLLGIESGRGIAAMLVVFYHAARHLKQDIGYLPLGGISQFGHAGVDFFFVLSGFIIYYVHAGDWGRPDRLGHYLQRRFVRIYPFFWCVLGVSLVLLAMSSHLAFPGAGKIIKTFFLLPQFDDPLVGVAWTLELEALFYLIFATAILNVRAGWALFASWLAFILVCNVTGYESSHWVLLNKLGASYDIEFFLGIAAAAIIRRTSYVPMSGVLLPVGIVLFFTSGTLENIGLLDGYATIGRYVYGIPAFLILLGLADRERSGKLQLHPLLVTLGSASYSIYLTHLLSIGVVYKLLSVFGLLKIFPAAVTYLLLCVCSIAIAVLISRWVEYPLMRQVRRIFA